MSHGKSKKAHGSQAGTCSNCGTTTAEAGSLKYCGRCRKAAYCSEACQKQHWKSGGHKQQCTAPTAENSRKTSSSPTKKGNMSMAEALLMARSELQKIRKKMVAAGFVKSLMRQNRLNKLFISGMEQSAAMEKAFKDDAKHEDHAHELGERVASFARGDVDALPAEVMTLIRETETLHYDTPFAETASKQPRK